MSALIARAYGQLGFGTTTIIAILICLLGTQIPNITATTRRKFSVGTITSGKLVGISLVAGCLVIFLFFSEHISQWFSPESSPAANATAPNSPRPHYSSADTERISAILPTLSGFADQADHLDINVQQQLANEDNQFTKLTLQSEKVTYVAYRDNARMLLANIRKFISEHNYDKEELQRITAPLTEGVDYIASALSMMSYQLDQINDDERNWLPRILGVRDNLRNMQMEFAKHIKEARNKIDDERKSLNTL